MGLAEEYIPEEGKAYLLCSLDLLRNSVQGKRSLKPRDFKLVSQASHGRAYLSLTVKKPNP